MIHYKGGKPVKKKRQGKPLTKEDIERLMNVNMPTYHRAKGGAWKQK
ncbi:hypothetical protein OYT88_11810 [Sporolactobacillus sp. CQH2019]|nr:hypothetical protein [Sporolactobacillus sp. CQH2019]MDD9149239.1 hypothetical protein [Sporolactobacillus sp. CQH2019]